MGMGPNSETGVAKFTRRLERRTDTIMGLATREKSLKKRLDAAKAKDAAATKATGVAGRALESRRVKFCAAKNRERKPRDRVEDLKKSIKLGEKLLAEAKAEVKKTGTDKKRPGWADARLRAKSRQDQAFGMVGFLDECLRDAKIVLKEADKESKAARREWQNAGNVFRAELRKSVSAGKACRKLKDELLNLEKSAAKKAPARKAPAKKAASGKKAPARKAPAKKVPVRRKK